MRQWQRSLTRALKRWRNIIVSYSANSPTPNAKPLASARILKKAEKRTKLQDLTAPVDGVVQQLSVHTVGGVVTPAQQLAVVVPSDTTLEVEAMISNRDIGFVHVGQEAQIKVDTFNFTRYGLLHGRVVSVSQDAIVRDIPTDKNKRQYRRCGRRKQRAEGPRTQLRCASVAGSDANSSR